MELPRYFTNYEKDIVRDQNFLKAKHDIIEKVHQLFSVFQENLRKDLTNNPPVPQLPCDLQSGKISKGDNYENMPWLISDYPRIFSRKRVFAFRVLFWWGHHFSFNFHLQGDLLHEYRQVLENNLDDIIDKGYFICCGDSPWDYNFETPGFIQLNTANLNQSKEIAREHEFIKIAKQIPVNSTYEEITMQGRHTFDEFLIWAGHIRK